MTLSRTLFLFSFLLCFLQGQVLANVSVQEKVLSIISCNNLKKSLKAGHAGDVNKTLPIIEEKERSLRNLNYIGIIPWKPSRWITFHRDLIRKHKLDFVANKRPPFDTTQKLGVDVVDVRDIRFSQVMAKNSSGQYTVVDNAKAFQVGALKPEDLPPIQVWRDTDGRVWTLDHRRVIAMKMAGNIREVPVTFVSKEIVDADKYKFATRNDGKSIFLRLDELDENGEPIAIIVGDKGVLDNVSKKSVQEVKTTYKNHLNTYDQKLVNDWLKDRGPEHLKKLDEMSAAFESSLKGHLSKVNEDFLSQYGKLGEVQARVKTKDSLLAKLISKDIKAFQKGRRGIEDLEDVKKAIGDGIGIRIILNTDKDGKLKHSIVSEVVPKMKEDMQRGYYLTEIMNYRARGNNNLAYMDEKNFGHLTKFARASNPDLIIKTGPSASFDTGYSGLHYNINLNSGVQMEVQLRGQTTHTASQIQHLFYDIKQNKPIPLSVRNNKYLNEAAGIFSNYPENKKAEIMKYVEARLIHARKLEEGIPSTPPSLPDGFPQILSFEELEKHIDH